MHNKGHKFDLPAIAASGSKFLRTPNKPMQLTRRRIPLSVPILPEIELTNCQFQPPNGPVKYNRVCIKLVLAYLHFQSSHMHAEKRRASSSTFELWLFFHNSFHQFEAKCQWEITGHTCTLTINVFMSEGPINN
jgi:hypothetical protein